MEFLNTISSLPNTDYIDIDFELDIVDDATGILFPKIFPFLCDSFL